MLTGTYVVTSLIPQLGADWFCHRLDLVDSPESVNE